MEIKVTFRFDASDKLLECVENFKKAAVAIVESGMLSMLPQTKEEGVTKAIATAEGVTMNKKEQIWPPKGEQESAETSEAAETSETAAAAAEASDASASGAPESDVPTVADMRAAVTRCRERIEGEDWEDKSGVGYKTYHKKVTAAVKGIVGLCGADKIPDIAEEKRAAFIQQVDSLKVTDAGNVESDLPF